ncbi:MULTISPECIES: tRNA (guanosine(37)-N1)-methyltransferase TrmD [unclassified Adlercreutzia]|uniref:tRNA (guanosine(37)-N1)-methyltransferase TrmD n=1 Tax=unclassified Adlercreutzia TaxID=2636013 RepID=UPI0013EBC7A4|nr:MULTISPECIES: tRNA (guanosine(37)-N1)-methyltransferase TrmD [unclassified Adlercreutzia]
MIIETLSTFPRMYDSVMGSSMMKRAQDKGIIAFHAHDLRDWTHDRHRTTDDDPYGGGAGLVMKCEPIFEAYEDIVGASAFAPVSAALLHERGNAQSLRQSCSRESATGAFGSCGTRLVSTPPPAEQGCSAVACGEGSPERADAPGHARPTVIFLAPQGRPFDDAYASELAQRERLLFICGHYEGIDERAYVLADEVISLGDYVLTSGELASMVVIDAVVRKLPGVLGAPDGPVDESFTSGLLEYPQYTRPASFRGQEVPAVLLSGDHGAVARWRRNMSLERTARWRPDLLEEAERAGNLTPADREFLETLAGEQGS